MTARRVLLVALALPTAGAATAAACATFNFPYPEPQDAACSAQALSGYLSVADAVRVCSEVATCPGLDVSISASIALPLDLTGGSFAACVDWLAGSTSANRVGFAIQQQMLQCMAAAEDAASPCDAAFACAFIRPIDAGCTIEECLDGGAGIVRCIDGVELESPCGAPLWADGSSCFLDDSLVPLCGTRDASCGTAGATCTSATTVSVCPSKFSTNSPWTLNCGVFGEVCSGAGCDAPIDAGACGQPLGCTDDGRAIRYCNPRPQIQSTFDCSQSGRACALANADAGPPYCKGPCDTCTPFDQGMGRCVEENGTAGVTLCIDGVPSTYACNCVTDPGGEHCE